MALIPSTNTQPHGCGIHPQLTPDLRSSSPLYSLGNFLGQTTDLEPISSRLFFQSEEGLLPMDPAGPLPEKAGRFPYLPSPHLSSIGDPEVVPATASDGLVYGAGFNSQHRQNGIQNGYSNLRERAKDIEAATFQRAPYSPESLTSDYRHPTETSNALGELGHGSGSPIQRLPNTGAYDNSTSSPYLPTGFTAEKESPSHHSPSARINRARYHPYSPEFPRSYAESFPPAVASAGSYNERLSQRPRELPRASAANGDHVHSSSIDHLRDGQGPPWPRSWMPSTDIHVSHYPSYSFSTGPHPEPSYVTAQFESAATYMNGGGGGLPAGQQNRSTKSHSLDVLSPGAQHTNSIHCPHCSQTFPTAEQYTKHQQKHQKMYRCRFSNCTRTEGFATPNDRERHEKSVHKIAGFYWRCLDPSCSSFRKEFARRDNLKDHLKRMHTMPPGVDEVDANAWRNQMADSGKYEKAEGGRSLR